MTEIISHSYGKKEPKINVISGNVNVTVPGGWFFGRTCLTENNLESINIIDVPDNDTEIISDGLGYIGFLLMITGIGAVIGAIMFFFGWASYAGGEIQKNKMTAFMIKIHNDNYIEFMTEDRLLIQRLTYLMNSGQHS